MKLSDWRAQCAAADRWLSVQRAVAAEMKIPRRHDELLFDDSDQLAEFIRRATEREAARPTPTN